MNRARIARMPVIGPLLLRWKRKASTIPFLRGKRKEIQEWLRNSKESTNFNYNLKPSNEEYLAILVSYASRKPLEEIKGYMSEIKTDEAFRQYIREKIRASEFSFRADEELRFHRRLGWYAFVRALKPRLVIETGVDKGLGSCTLCAAILRNRAEGHAGRYLGTDIDPNAGYLLGPPYSEAGEILYGDSIESLKKIDGPVDIFLNDSDHSAEYEAKEYEIIAPKLSPHAVILGDNSHATDKLMQFALRTGRKYLFFDEEPEGHWYPGGGLGIAFYENSAD